MSEVPLYTFYAKGDTPALRKHPINADTPRRPPSFSGGEDVEMHGVHVGIQCRSCLRDFYSTTLKVFHTTPPIISATRVWASQTNSVIELLSVPSGTLWTTPASAWKGREFRAVHQSTLRVIREVD